MGEHYFIEKPIMISELQLRFDDNFYDYYLTAPGIKDGYYIISIADTRVGFGSKYHLHKLIRRLQEELYSNGIIPPNNIVYAKIPEISEPVIRRLGDKVKELNKDKKTDKNIFGELPPDIKEISTGSEDSHAILNLKPTGPFI